MITDEELKQLRQQLNAGTAEIQSQVISELLDEIDELKADRDEWMRMAGRLADAKKVASREKERSQ